MFHPRRESFRPSAIYRRVISERGRSTTKKERHPSIYDIARETGCSAATVSRALNHPDRVSGETLRRIRSAMASSGFQKRSYRSPGAAGAHRRTDSYLLSIPSPLNPFYGRIIEGVTTAAAAHACRVYVDYTLFLESRGTSPLPVPTLRDFDGLILMNGILDEQLLVLSRQIPLIQCSEYNDAVGEVSSVSIDDEAGEMKAAQHVIASGSGNIAYLSCPLSMSYARRRLKGFRRACLTAGVPVTDEQIVVLPQAGYDAALSAAHRLLTSPARPDAIVCSSDIYAIACLRAARELGISVPGELSITGFDDIPMASMTELALTTIRQPCFQLGYTAFETLYYELLHPDAAKQRILLPTELIIRETTIL